MKRITYLLSAMCALFICACSSSDEPVPQDKSEVSFFVDYAFKEGGSLSRANSDVYTAFYNEKVKTSLLAPETYSLKFTSKDEETSYEFYGKWADKDLITLMEGEYTVTGHSTASGNYIQDKVSLMFQQDITITKGMEHITLSAIYDCFLLFFNKSDLVELNYNRTSSGSSPNTVIEMEWEYEDYYYAFSRSLDTGFFYGEREDESYFRYSSTEYPFEKGKYYFFNDVTCSFSDIPEMEAGN